MRHVSHPTARLRECLCESRVLATLLPSPLLVEGSRVGARGGTGRHRCREPSVQAAQRAPCAGLAGCPLRGPVRVSLSNAASLCSKRSIVTRMGLQRTGQGSPTLTPPSRLPFSPPDALPERTLCSLPPRFSPPSRDCSCVPRGHSSPILGQSSGRS